MTESFITLSINFLIKYQMKKILYSVLAVAALLCSCTKETVQPSPDTGEKVRLGISVPVAGVTKVTDISTEKQVNRIQVFVFREDGAVDTWGTAEADHLVLECTSGSREIVVLANAPQVSDIFALSDLENEISGLTDNAPGALVMAGRKTVDLSLSSEVTVPVTRLVARVSIEKISTAFSLGQFNDADFIVRRIYLTNVAGDVPYLKSSAPQTWYNKMGYSAEAANLIDSGELEESVTPETAYADVHYFYCYPNASDDSFEEIWTPRHTRLVVEADLAGVRYYYPVTMPVIEANHTYTVTELKITGPGSSSPEIPVERLDATFNVVVDDWDEGYSGSFEI